MSFRDSLSFFTESAFDRVREPAKHWTKHTVITFFRPRALQTPTSPVTNYFQMTCKSLLSIFLLTCLTIAWMTKETCARPAGFSENHVADTSRPRRGFKNAGLATARGFGKRASWIPSTPVTDDPESLAVMVRLVQLLNRHPELYENVDHYDAELGPDSAEYQSSINAWNFKE